MVWAAAWLAAHGYLAVAGILLLSALGLPMPVGPVLMLAGSAAHQGKLSLGVLLLIAIMAEEIGATSMFFAGRLTGWWLLGKLCQLSLNPEVCIFRSADFFYERGYSTLIFARFIPGLNTMGAPLAGSLNMRPTKFWRFDIVGACLHVGTWVTTGYFLSPFIQRITSVLSYFGRAVLGLVLLMVLGYAIYLMIRAFRSRKYARVARVTADALRERIEHPDPEHPIVIADVRSHGYYEPGMMRIKNSIRIEPNRLLPELEALRETIAPACDIYVYCSCRRDATSARIAHMLEERGSNVFVIEGGLSAWTKAGCPIEPVPEQDMQHLPRFT